MASLSRCFLWTAVTAVALLCGCAGASTGIAENSNTSADISGHETAVSAAEASRQSQPDDANDTDGTSDKHRWIYATNTDDTPDNADGPATVNKPKDSSDAGDAEVANETNKPSISGRAPALQMMIKSDGSIHTPQQAFEQPVEAATWTKQTLSTSPATTVELHVSPTVSSERLQQTIDALRKAGVTTFSVRFSPESDRDDKESDRGD